jgi:hypothetical protein
MRCSCPQSLTQSRAILVALSLGLVSVAGAASASAQLATIRGKVSTQSGAPVEDLKVWVVDPAGQKPSRHTDVKDPNGEYKIERVPFGTYKMFACDSPGYAPSESRILPIANGDVRGIDFVLRDPRSRDGGLRGTLQGPKGSIAGVSIEVVLKDAETGCDLAHTATRERDGKYDFAGLAAPRLYEVTSDYSKTTPFRVRVEPATTAQADLTLDVGGYQAIAELAKTPGSSIVEVDHGDAGEISQVVEIVSDTPHPPLSDRPFALIGLLSPSLAVGADHGSSAGDESWTQVYERTGLGPLPRASPSDAGAGSTPILLGSVSNNGFGGLARIGHAATNSFHGTAEYSIRNEALDARNFFALPGFDISRQHRLQASIGGPIWKNRIFFFVDDEFLRHAQAPTFSSIVTSNLGQLNLQLVRLGFPPENLRRFTTRGAQDSPLLRIDVNLSKTQQVTVRYAFDRELHQNEIDGEQGGTSPLPSSARDVLLGSHFVTVQYNASFASEVVSEAAYSYRHVFVGIGPKEPNQTSFLIPGIAILGRSTDLVNGNGGGSTAHKFSEALNGKLGRHSWGLGARLEFDEYILHFAAFEHGRAVIPGLAAFYSKTPVADLFEHGVGGSEASSGSSLLGLNAQDSFEISRELTLNFDALYGVQFTPSVLRTQQTIQPRIGLAWHPGRVPTTFKISYGISRQQLDQFPANLELLMGGQGLRSDIPTPTRLITSFVGSSPASTALNQFLTVGTVPFGPQLATVYDRASRSPTISNAGISLENKFRIIRAELSYSYVRGLHLLTATNINLPTPILVAGRPDFQNATVNPAFAQIYQFETAGSSTYHGVEIRAGLQHPIRGFQFDSWYRFSRTIDDLSSGSFEATPENVFDRKAERAVSDLNVGHDFYVSGSWNRSPRIRKNVLLNLISQPYVQSFLRMQSGRRLDVLAGLDANHDGNPLTDRPLNVARNTFLGPHFFQLDTTVGFEPRLTESIVLKLYVIALNTLNHVNFGTIDTVIGQADLSGLDPRIVFGRESVSGFDFRRPLVSGGFGLATNASDPRRLQFGLKLSF